MDVEILKSPAVAIRRKAVFAIPVLAALIAWGAWIGNANAQGVIGAVVTRAAQTVSCE